MAKSFLYPAAKLAEAFGCGEPYCPICQTNCPPAFTEALKDGPTVFRPSESQFNAPFTVLRTNDTEKRLTEREGNDD